MKINQIAKEHNVSSDQWLLDGSYFLSKND